MLLISCGEQFNMRINRRRIAHRITIDEKTSITEVNIKCDKGGVKNVPMESSGLFI